MTTARKQQMEETDGTNANAGGDRGMEGKACRCRIFTVERPRDKASGPELALALLGIDTLKRVGRISRIMGEWKWVEL